MARRPRAYLPGTPSKEKTRAGRLARASLSPPSPKKKNYKLRNSTPLKQTCKRDLQMIWSALPPVLPSSASAVLQMDEV
jgi:hypothetical protein